MLPNQKVAKDPYVENTGTNDALVFLKVTAPKANIIVAANDGTRGQAALQEIFSYQRGNEDEGFQDGFNTDAFMQIAKEDSDSTVSYVFAYNNALPAGQETTALFDHVQLKNVIEGQVDATTQNIDVKAYAIQATDILDASGDDITDGTLDEATLKSIYDVYVKQNDGIAEDTADSNGDKNLKGETLAQPQP